MSRRNLMVVVMVWGLILLVACQNDTSELAGTPEPTSLPETAISPTAAPVEEVETTTVVDPPAESTAEAVAESSEELSPDDEIGRLPEEIVTQLDDFLQAQVYTDGAPPSMTAPGLVLLVDTPEGQYLQAAGVASIEDGTPMKVDDRLEIGSNSKSFTIVLLMQLQEEGILSLDDQLSDWLPELAADIPNGNQMTLRQLAQHTSGIWDYGDPIIGEAANNPDKLEQGYTPGELVQYAIDNGTPDFPPGAEGEWKYSNTGYILLGMIIEEATGNSLDNLLQVRIFEPLGMESAALIPGVPEPGEIVNGYWWQDDGTRLNTTNWNVSQGWAAGGLAMTAQDLLTYVKALSAGELFQDPDSLAQMLTFDPNGLDGLFPYGLGLFDLSVFPGASGSWGHEGQTAGFQSLWFTNPDTGITVIGLSNSATYYAFSFGNAASIITPGADDETAVPDDSVDASCPLFDLPYPRPEPVYTGKLERDFTSFATALGDYTPEEVAAREALVNGKTIPELQALMDNGQVTSAALVVYYLERIQRYDVNKLNSVLELNPEALDSAQSLDDERAAGDVRGLMHGIPVLLKDNIATGDQLHTAAGSAAMVNWDPVRDAFLVNQLRDAGAVILGKANLSEWANYMDPCMPNGFSANGGQTQNPYGPFDTYGSSSGSAVSVSAELTTVSVGTETQGSIIAPAGINSVVGLKTSMGLVSRDYVIPLLPFQDVPGPIGRTVTDVAILLSAMTGVDENDPATEAASSLAGVDFTQYLTAATWQQVRVGLPAWNDEAFEKYFSDSGVTDVEQQDALREAFVGENERLWAIGEALSEAGVIVVELPATAVPQGVDVPPLLEYGYQDAINAFLSDLGDAAPVTSLADIVAFNKGDFANRAPYGQGFLEASQSTQITAEEYAQKQQENFDLARTGLDNMFQTYDIDVIVSSVNQLYAPAGYPALAIPSGYAEDGSPESVVFVGSFLSEPQLLAVGYAYERATQARVTPDLDATITLINQMTE